MNDSLWRELIDGLTPDIDVSDQFAEEWADWHARGVPSYLWPPYADYHREFWDWVWSIKAGQPSKPFIAIWPRGFAKSTSIECSVAALAARGARRYALYICATQDQADTHVENIAAIMETDRFGEALGRKFSRHVGKYGNSKGWRRNRLRTSNGFTVDAIGLDTAARGAKVDDARPDLLIFDDVDEILDSPGTVDKKITTITKSLLPARATHAAVMVGQNLIHSDGIVSRLADGRADFLQGGTVSGPHPAIDGLVTEQRSGKFFITGGTSTWPAKSIPDLQAEMDELGYSAFMSEKQHDVDAIDGGIFGHVEFRHCTWDELPTMVDIQVWVDPAVTDTDKSDAHGIQADGLGVDDHLYRLYSWEHRSSPEDSLRRAILKAIELRASCVGVETDQGGDTWKSTYENVWRKMVEEELAMLAEIDESERPEPKLTAMPEFRQAKAGAGHGPKAERATKMLADYERGKIIHVEGSHVALERALKRYLLRKPYDLVDAGYWSWYGLMGNPRPVIAGPAIVRQSSVWG